MALFALAMVVVSCEKVPSGKEPGGAKAAKINIEIQKYYNELGTMSLKNWEAGDKVAAFNADNAAPVVSYGSPITTGAQSALFTIAVTDVENGNNVMAYYPSAADMTPVSGGLKAKIPNQQNGSQQCSVNLHVNLQEASHEAGNHVQTNNAACVAAAVAEDMDRSQLLRRGFCHCSIPPK